MSVLGSRCSGESNNWYCRRLTALPPKECERCWMLYLSPHAMRFRLDISYDPYRAELQREQADAIEWVSLKRVWRCGEP